VIEYCGPWRHHAGELIELKQPKKNYEFVVRVINMESDTKKLKLAEQKKIEKELIEKLGPFISFGSIGYFWVNHTKSGFCST